MIFGSEKVIIDETKLVEVSKNHYIITIKKSRHVARGNNIEKKVAIEVTKSILKIIQVLSKFRKIFNTRASLRYHIQQLKKFKTAQRS